MKKSKEEILNDAYRHFNVRISKNEGGIVDKCIFKAMDDYANQYFPVEQPARRVHCVCDNNIHYEYMIINKDKILAYKQKGKWTILDAEKALEVMCQKLNPESKSPWGTIPETDFNYYSNL